MCFGGGGGDPGAAARQAEEQRQARIKAAQEAVHGTFAGANREPLYAQHQQAVYDLNMEKLARDKSDADRQLGMMLARRGLSGGTAAVDARQRLGQNYDEALLEVQRFAQGAGAGLRQRDEQLKSNLLGQASTGMDATTAASQANALLASNLDEARTQNQYATLGDLFAGVALANYVNQQRAGQQDAARIVPDEDIYNTYVSSPGKGGYSGRTARIG